jgi:uncharacterized delta-60 repeat protein
VDPTFNPNPEASSSNQPSIGLVVVQSDGRLLVRGSFNEFDGVERNRPARLNADGSLDTSFDADTTAFISISCMALQADGRILLGGNETNSTMLKPGRIARLNADGSLDASFSCGPIVGGGPEGGPRTIIVQPDGKLIVTGSFSSVDGISRNQIFGVTYTIEYHDSLSSSGWQKLMNVTAPETDDGLGVGVFEVRDPLISSGERYYRAVHPAY